MRTVAIMIVSALVCASRLSNAALPAGEDGMQVLLKVQAAYAALSSYAQHTSASLVAHINGVPHVSAGRGELRLRRPNALYVEASDPRHGSIFCASTGRQMVVYHATLNVYRKAPPPATPGAFLQNIAKEGIGGIPSDPLELVCGISALKILSGATVKGSGDVNGNPCIVLEATEKLPAGARIVAPRITLWVDKKTYLLWKVRRVVTGIRGMTRSEKVVNGKTVAQLVPATADETITETVQDMKVNPSLTDADFTCQFPATASEQKE